jgi:hypothetical protein
VPSQPRSATTIVIGEFDGRIFGPEWEYKFAARANDIEFEIETGRRLTLRRNGETWIGEYSHPPIRPGDDVHETHPMLFVRDRVASRWFVAAKRSLQQ